MQASEWISEYKDVSLLHHKTYVDSRDGKCIY